MVGNLGALMQRGILAYKLSQLNNAPLRASVSFARVLSTCVAVHQVKAFISLSPSVLPIALTIGQENHVTGSSFVTSKCAHRC